MLFDSLLGIFREIYEFEIEDRKVRRRFLSVSDNSSKDEGEGYLEKVLTSRQKKTQRHQDEYNTSFVSPGDKLGNLGSTANYMLKDSILDGEQPSSATKSDQYLMTERDDEEEKIVD